MFVSGKGHERRGTMDLQSCRKSKRLVVEQRRAWSQTRLHPQ